MQDAEQLGTMNIKKLALKISIPMVISMISIALYGIVDTIFISHISDKALETASLSEPIRSIVTSIGLGLSIGINAILSKSLGEKDLKKANKIIGYGIIFTFISWAIIATASIFGIKSFFGLFTQNDEIKSLGYQYLSITSIFSFGTLFQILFEKILEAYGKSKESMIIQISGAVINLILDPILIFGFGKIPALGIKGAAIATVLGQIIGMIIGIAIILKYKIFSLKMYRETRAEFNTIKEIFKVGIPTILLEAMNSFILLYLNKVLIEFSENAVSVWNIYGQLQRAVIIIVYGLNYGMIPIISYNYGAKNNERIHECIKFFLQLAFGVTLVGELLFLIIPEVLLSIFKVTEEIKVIAIPAFRILSIGFTFAGISLVFSAISQAFGNGTYSLIINLLRKILIVIPLIFIFKDIFGIYTIWISFDIAEIVTTIVAILLYNRIKKKM